MLKPALIAMTAALIAAPLFVAPLLAGPAAPPPPPVDAPAAAAAPLDGAALFAQRCAGCHVPQEGKPPPLGPTLTGVFGRAAGTQPGYAYTDELKASGLTWDRETLDSFLKSPVMAVPGTRMAPSLTRSGERAAIIDYLAAQGS